LSNRICIILDVKSDLNEIRHKTIFRYAEVVGYKEDVDEILVKLLDDTDENCYIATEIAYVDKYPSNFKEIKGVELDDITIDQLVKDAYTYDEDIVIRAGNVVVIKIANEVYVAENAMVNNRVI